MNSRSDRASLVILISGRGSNLRSLVKAQADRSLDCDLDGVISNRPDAPGIAWANAQGIATRSIDHRAYDQRAGFDAALAQAIEEMVPAGRHPWVVLAGFMRILGDAFIARHSGRVVNIHPSLLPSYPGLRTHRQALADGAMLHGATVHIVTPRLDHGPIIAQAVVPVLASDDEEALAARVLAMEHRLYPVAMRWLTAGRITVDRGRVLLDGIDAPERRMLLHPLLIPASAAGPATGTAAAGELSGGAACG